MDKVLSGSSSEISLDSSVQSKGIFQSILILKLVPRLFNRINKTKEHLLNSGSRLFKKPRIIAWIGH